jgi:hypothetical protein
MPKQGFRVVTIRESVLLKASELGKKMNKSLPQVIAEAIEEMDKKTSDGTQS